VAAATILNFVGLCFGLVSAVFLVRSLDPLLNVLTKASSPTVVSVSQEHDEQAIAQLGQDVSEGAALSRRRVYIGCFGLSVGFALQVGALFA
jgi:hypothetical protein